MSRPKLGELLLQNGLIGEEQLAQALQSQVVNAGRLGSNVVELGFTSVDAVADLLAFQLGVPAAGPAELGAVDARVLAALPAEVCGRYKLLPFALLGQTLHVAMQDPQHTELIDYLRNGLRVQIKPYVVPQLRLLYYLERYYQLPRPKRFLRQPGVPAARDERRTYLQPTVAPAPAPAATAAAAPPRPRPFGGTTSGNFELVYLDEVPRPAAEEAFDVEVELPATPAPAGDVPALEQMLEAIDQATTRDALIKALVQPVGSSTTLSLLLLPRAEMAVGLAAWGTALPQEQVRSLVVPANVPSLLQQAAQALAPVRGRAADDALQVMIATYLRAPRPQACCVVPVVMLGRVINFICVQSTTPLSDDEVGHLQRVASQAASAYERLVRRHQGAAS